MKATAKQATVTQERASRRAYDESKRRRFADKVRELEGKVQLTVDVDALRGRSR